MMYVDLREEMRRKYGAPELLTATSVDTPPVEVERAFVTHAKSGRTVITAPLREISAANPGFMYLRGRFVEADTPNRNLAYWTTEDLQLGEGTVAGGPLNWLHQETNIIGSILQGQMETARERSDAGPAVGNHIVADAAVWRFIFPKQSQIIEKAAADGELYYSMECLSRQVACLDTPGRPGCGEAFDYVDYDAGRTCDHLRERSSVRRFIDPLFLGGAIIVPPVSPGWANADVELVKAAEATAERAHLDDTLSKAQAVDLATAVLMWANRD